MIYEVRLSSGTLIGLADIDVESLGPSFSLAVMRGRIDPWYLAQIEESVTYHQVSFRKQKIYWGNSEINVLVVDMNSLKHMRGQRWFKEIKPFKRRK